MLFMILLFAWGAECDVFWHNIAKVTTHTIKSVHSRQSIIHNQIKINICPSGTKSKTIKRKISCILLFSLFVLTVDCRLWTVVFFYSQRFIQPFRNIEFPSIQHDAENLAAAVFQTLFGGLCHLPAGLFGLENHDYTVNSSRQGKAFV
jgi:hypothetical protein